MKPFPPISLVDRVVIALALLKLAVIAVFVHSAFSDRAEAEAQVAVVEMDGGAP